MGYSLVTFGCCAYNTPLFLICQFLNSLTVAADELPVVADECAGLEKALCGVLDGFKNRGIGMWPDAWMATARRRF